MSKAIKQATKEVVKAVVQTMTEAVGSTERSNGAAMATSMNAEQVDHLETANL